MSHTFADRYPAPTRLLQVDSALALDGYFRDLAEALRHGGAVDPARVPEIMSRHGTWSVETTSTEVEVVHGP